MRFVNKELIEMPEELRAENCHNHLLDIITDPENNDPDPNIYRGKKVLEDDTVRYTVRDALKNLYKCKCAYCEKYSHNPKIDHHRPKGKVSGTGNNNKGYYWLCYEWTNLVPCCTDCNSIGSKGAKYPLTNINLRNNAPPKLNNLIDIDSFKYNSEFNTAESPLLLHPEYCVPDEHFNFEKDGKIIGVSDKGVATIVALNLDNDDLNGWRRSIYNNHLNNLRKLVRNFYAGYFDLANYLMLIQQWVEVLINESMDEELEYLLFRKFLLKKIDYFFITEFEDVFRNDLQLIISDSILNVLQEHHIELH